MLFKNVMTALRRPSLAIEYLSYLRQQFVSRQGVVRRFPGGIEIGSLVNFSEYHSCARFLSDEELKFFRSFAFGEGDFLDVGANVGVLTLYWAKLFPDRRIFAFEPSPTTFAALVANVARNGATNVVPLETAVSDKDGRIAFDGDPVARGTAAIAGGASAKSFLVATAKLDSLSEQYQIKKIALLKVDVEGFETLVFAGAQAVFQSVRPRVVYFEVCPELTTLRGFDPVGPAKYLVEAKYELFRISDGG